MNQNKNENGNKRTPGEFLTDVVNHAILYILIFVLHAARFFIKNRAISIVIIIALMAVCCLLYGNAANYLTRRLK
jgi:hypothetical protein